MKELKKLTIARTRQLYRLAELVELCGGLDPEHPLQRYSIRRIAWLEKQIAEKTKKEGRT